MTNPFAPPHRRWVTYLASDGHWRSAPSEPTRRGPLLLVNEALHADTCPCRTAQPTNLDYVIVGLGAVDTALRGLLGTALDVGNTEAARLVVEQLGHLGETVRTVASYRDLLAESPG